MTGDVKHDLGMAVAKRRKAMGYSQAQLAEKIGVEQETISRVERGTMGLQLDRIGDLATALNCPVADLFAEPSDDLQMQGRKLSTLLAGLPLTQRELVLKVVEDLVIVLRTTQEPKKRPK